MKRIEKEIDNLFATRLLRAFCPPQLLEEIEGDLMQRYERDMTTVGEKKARRKLFWNTIRYLRIQILLRNRFSGKQKNTIMLKDYFKIANRQLTKNKAFTLINIIGMSLGLAIAMLILLYVRFELSYENHNPLADRIVRISMDYYNGETVIDQDAEMYSPAGPRINSEFSEVENFTRASPFSELTVRVGDEFFRETKVFAVDPTLFELFNYSLLYGNPNDIFTTPFEIVLTESQALKYFNRKDVVGETLWISLFNQDCKITGVVAESPPNTHFKFDVLLSFASVKDDEVKRGWNNNETYTYLLLSDNVRYSQFQSSLNSFNDRLHKEKIILNERIVAQPIKDIHLYSNKSYEMEQNGDATSVFLLLGVAILVVVIAIVNYINLSTSKSLDRAKEVGIRKVVGSSLGQLRAQFFTESFLINFLAGALALVLMLLALPLFRNISGLPNEFHFWDSSFFWYFLLIVIFLSTILSGIFPAFILSAFQPISVLKGKFSKSGTGVMLRKGLVIFQFTITLFLLIQTFTAEQQLTFMREKKLGLNIDHTIVIRLPSDQKSRDNSKSFKDQLLKHTQFQSASFSSSVPGQPSSTMGSTNAEVNLVGVGEKQSFNFYLYWIDADFIPTMQMKLKAGENFNAESLSEDKILVNEESIKLWGISEAESAIGRKIDLWGEQRTIIGVIEDFHQGSPKSPFIPMLFLNGPWSNRLTSVRTESSNVKENLLLVKEVYETIFTDSPFEYFFLDQEFDKQYRAEEQFQNVFGTLTGFAIIISCLGLFGLVSFSVASRTKEVSIRKVLGAEVNQIVTLLSKDFISLILISMVISTVITYFLLQQWLERYAFRIELSVWLFAIPAVGVLLLSFLTIFIKTFQVSSANPVNSLRNE